MRGVCSYSHNRNSRRSCSRIFPCSGSRSTSSRGRRTYNYSRTSCLRPNTRRNLTRRFDPYLVTFDLTGAYCRPLFVVGFANRCTRPTAFYGAAKNDPQRFTEIGIAIIRRREFYFLRHPNGSPRHVSATPDSTLIKSLPHLDSGFTAGRNNAAPKNDLNIRRLRFWVYALRVPVLVLEEHAGPIWTSQVSSYRFFIHNETPLVDHCYFFLPYESSFPAAATRNVERNVSHRRSVSARRREDRERLHRLSDRCSRR